MGDKKFDFVRNMPTVRTAKEFQTVLVDSEHDKMCTPNVEEIVKAFPSTKSKSGGVGISDLLTVLELAVNDDQQITVDSFTMAHTMMTWIWTLDLNEINDNFLMSFES